MPQEACCYTDGQAHQAQHHAGGECDHELHDPADDNGNDGLPHSRPSASFTAMRVEASPIVQTISSKVTSALKSARPTTLVTKAATVKATTATNSQAVVVNVVSCSTSA